MISRLAGGINFVSAFHLSEITDSLGVISQQIARMQWDFHLKVAKGSLKMSEYPKEIKIIINIVCQGNFSLKVTILFSDMVACPATRF